MFVPASVTIDGDRFGGLDINEPILLGTVLPGQTILVGFQVVVGSFPPNGVVANLGAIVTLLPGTLPSVCTINELAIVAPGGVPPRDGELLPVGLVFKPGITPAPGDPILQGPLTLPGGEVLMRNTVTIPGITLPPFPGLTTAPIEGIQASIVSQTVAVRASGNLPMPNLRFFQAFFGPEDQFFIGERITFTFFVINDGNATSARTFFTNVLPPNVRFIPGTVRVNRELRLNADPNRGISLGPIPPNEGVLVRFDFLVTGGGAIVNSAEATAEFLLPDRTVLVRRFQSPPRTNVILPISTESQSSLTKSASVGSAAVGDTFEYSIVVRNFSESIVGENVVLFDRLDGSLQFVSGSLRIDGVPQMDPQAGVGLGILPPGTSRTVTFSVRVQFEPEEGRIVNRAAAFFEFRFQGVCFRGGLISDPVVVRVAAEEEE